MPIRVGLLTEGNDHLILLSYLARLLEFREEELEPDVIDGSGHGWQFVATTIDRALRRFYQRCAKLAILCMDNDGNLDLMSSGGQQDARHPRHWLHIDQDALPDCRWCILRTGADATRPALNWWPGKPGQLWPIIIAVPVESIEAWLVTTQAIVTPGNGSLYAEQEARSTLKRRLYGRPEARRTDIEQIALPLIRQLNAEQLAVLETHSRSFSNFANQVRENQLEILTAPAC